MTSQLVEEPPKRKPPSDIDNIFSILEETLDTNKGVSSKHKSVEPVIDTKIDELDVAVKACE